MWKSATSRASKALRKHLNDRRPPAAPPLTFLPFIVAALARVLDKFPQCNALYDSARGVLVKHKAVHVGIATQTPQGLKVPVVRNAESRALHDLAAEIRRVAEAARNNKSPREELTGSTITITSLGKLGGIASTPMINMPEVSIIGINKAIERAVVVDGQITRAADDESVVVVRSSLRRRLRRRLDDPGAQGSARAAGDHLHRLNATRALLSRCWLLLRGQPRRRRSRCSSSRTRCSVEVTRRGNQWTAEYTFDREPPVAWLFPRTSASRARVDDAWRERSWKLETAGVRLERRGSFDVLVANRGHVPRQRAAPLHAADREAR